jgi:hypothetical protein
MHVNSIEPGHDFVQATLAALTECQIVVAVVGRSWLEGPVTRWSPARSDRRYVRVELEAALSQSGLIAEYLERSSSLSNQSCSGAKPTRQ